MSRTESFGGEETPPPWMWMGNGSYVPQGPSYGEAVQFAEPTLSSSDEDIWLYAPASLVKGPMEPRKRTTVVQFRMWREAGFFYCQAKGLENELKLPIYTADGCGYPALSAVIRTWQEHRSPRWETLKQYLAAAASRNEDQCPSVKKLLLETAEGTTLDRRFDVAPSERWWSGVVRLPLEPQSQVWVE